jgi:hypothetical protein
MDEQSEYHIFTCPESLSTSSRDPYSHRSGISIQSTAPGIRRNSIHQQFRHYWTRKVKGRTIAVLLSEPEGGIYKGGYRITVAWTGWCARCVSSLRGP